MSSVDSSSDNFSGAVLNFSPTSPGTGMSLLFPVSARFDFASKKERDTQDGK